MTEKVSRELVKDSREQVKVSREQAKVSRDSFRVSCEQARHVSCASPRVIDDGKSVMRAAFSVTREGFTISGAARSCIDDGKRFARATFSVTRSGAARSCVPRTCIDGGTGATYDANCRTQSGFGTEREGATFIGRKKSRIAAAFKELREENSCYAARASGTTVCGAGSGGAWRDVLENRLPSCSRSGARPSLRPVSLSRL